MAARVSGKLSPADMPGTLPIFPLQGVLLLPRSKLPLNIFEPRYLAMVEDALATRDKLIGMVQPLQKETKASAQPVYPVGCAGRIASWSETDDGRFLISLTGICRFAAGEEIATPRGYRRVKADFGAYAGDFQTPGEGAFDRKRLLAGLRAYFKAEGLQADWGTIDTAPDERLVNTIAMLCPFAPEEKQTLLESAGLAERAKAMIGIVETRASGAALGGLKH
jgi:Lon protease-like protein